MNTRANNKRDIFYFIVLILTLITMIVGVTFTLFSIISNEDEDSTQIKTGTLEINYIDGQTINTYMLLPIEEPTLDTTYSVYKKEFSVSSTGTLDQTIDIYMNIKENNFSKNSLKYALYDSNNKKLSSDYIPVEKGSRILLASDIYLKNNSGQDYKVLIWLQENGQNQNDEANKIFKGGFEITAEQIRYQ